MKRSIALSIMTCGLLMSAKTLTPEEALQRVYGGPSEMAKAPSAQTLTVTRTLESRDGEPMVYLFESDSDTWMAVSANDIAIPLLGYGDDALAGGDLPPQMEWWLGQYASQIQWADSMSRSGHIVKSIRTDAASKSSKAPTRADKEKIASLMSTKWDQDNPYNRLCPKIGFQRAPTGCVATALAQIMKYHEYPESGSGTGWATVGDNIAHEQMDLNIPLRWADMKNSYSSGFTSDQADAVAELMVAVGYGSHMNYNLGGSGAASTDAAKSMIENFGYANSTWLYMRDFYTLEEWEDMLYDELASGRPVFYTGYAEDGGHAFVCDGYNGDGYFKINWGWGGYYNGNFKIDALNPEGQGIGGFAGGYNSNQMAIMGLQPYFEGATHPAPTLSITNAPTASFSGDIVTLGGGWFNYGFDTTSFVVGVEVEAVSTGVKTVKEVGTYNVASYYGVNRIQAWLDPAIYPDGDYLIQVVTKTDEYPDWIPATHPLSVDPCVAYTKLNGNWFSSQEVPLQIVDSTYPGTLTIGLPSTFTVTAENPNSYALDQEYMIFVCALSGTGGAYIAAETDESDTFSISLEAGATGTFTKEFTLTEFDPEYCSGAHDLYLVLVNPETFQIDYSFGRVNLEGTEVLVESITLNRNKISAEEGSEVQLTAKIKPDYATNQTLEWASTDETVASVDETGLVKILSPGECEVSASTTDGSNLTATCAVTGIAGVEIMIEDVENADVYTLDGVRVDDVKSIKPGVYVVGGRKVIVK